MMETMNVVLNRVDELAILLNSLNRAIAKEDYETAYAISKKIATEASKLSELFYFKVMMKADEDG